jgi:putative transposase
MTGAKIVAALSKASVERDGSPMSITCDNGSEFASRIVEAWAIDNEVRLCFIRPGRPVEMDLQKALTGAYAMSVST